MNEFGIQARPEARAYLERIATAMMELFKIGRGEAVARIHGFWSGEAFLSDDAMIALRHGDPEYWAKTIYLGAKWWLKERP